MNHRTAPAYVMAFYLLVLLGIELDLEKPGWFALILCWSYWYFIQPLRKVADHE